MKAIPRLIAGTAVALAAVLTAAPLGAGFIDIVPHPGHGKRPAGPALTAHPAQTVVAQPVRARDAVAPHEGRWHGGKGADRHLLMPPTPTVALAPRTVDSTVPEASTPTSAVAAGAGGESVEARITELAADLQAGVRSGEFTQVDADRVLTDLSGYIRGERTWPERSVV